MNSLKFFWIFIIFGNLFCSNIIMLTEYSQINEQSLYQQVYSQSQINRLTRIAANEPINTQDQYQIQEYSYIEQDSQDRMSDFQKQALIQIQAQTNHILELEQKIYYYRNQCLKALKENEVLREEKKSMDQKNKNILDRMNEVEKQLKDQFAKKIDKVQQKIRKKDKIIQDLKSNMKKQKINESQSETQYMKMKEKIAKLQKEKDTQLQKLKQLQRCKVRQKEIQIQKLEEQLRSKQKQIQSFIEKQKLIQRERHTIAESQTKTVVKNSSKMLNFIPHTLLSNELLHQQHLIINLSSKNEQLLKINSFLKEQLRLAEQRLIHMELDTHNQIHHIHADNLIKLKDHNFNTIDRNKQTINYVSKRQEQRDLSSDAKQYKTLQKKSYDLNNIARNNIHIDFEKMRPISDPKPYRKMNNSHQLQNIKKKYLQ